MIVRRLPIDDQLLSRHGNVDAYVEQVTRPMVSVRFLDDHVATRDAIVELLQLGSVVSDAVLELSRMRDISKCNLNGHLHDASFRSEHSKQSSSTRRGHANRRHSPDSSGVGRTPQSAGPIRERRGRRALTHRFVLTRQRAEPHASRASD
jgi:hypothetical protein